MSVKTDRRTQSRKRPLSLVYVELPPSNGGMMRDLNEHGFALRAMMPLQLSEKLPFSISLDNGVRIDGEAIVVRLEDKGHVAALEFAGLAAHSRDQIHRWLEKFEEPLAREAWAPKPPVARASTLDELRHEARQVLAEPPAQHAEPLTEPPAPEQPLPSEPPLPPLAAPVAQPVIAPQHNIEPVQPPPPTPPALPVLPQIEVAPVLPQAHLEFPEAQPLTEPPAPALDSLTGPHFESAELPLPKFLRQSENASPPPAAPQLPPLLKLSSVRPSAPPEQPKEPVPPVVHQSVTEAPAAPPAPAPVPLSEILIQPPSVAAAHPSPTAAVPARAPARFVPPLEPLSTWEAESEDTAPGWLKSFTLGRAISIMVFLTLLVGSVVYHRDVGHALIWLGQQVAGEEPQETSPIGQSSAPPVVATPSASEAPANSPHPPSSPEQTATPPESKKNAASPLAPETPASPHTDANPAAEAVPADSSTGTGQDEYQRATQILKTPGRKGELPEAVRLLWIAVKKNHVGAEITLAELYHKGRGVAKSCEQTKILLSAAARKGSHDAKRRLQEFQRERCRD